jgi:ABC-2 type transport system permease protein
MLTPYPYLLYFPVGVYLGRIEGPDLWRGLAIQTAWVIGGFFLLQWVWSRGIKRYSAVGG